MSTILPLYDDDSDPIENEAEYFNADDTPRFWVPQGDNPLDEDLEALYWRHLLIDDPKAARAALHRMASALVAWSAEVATWGGDDLQPLWCRGCGEYSGGEPCERPSCADKPPTPSPAQPPTQPPPLPDPPPYPPGEEPGGPWPEPVITDEIQASLESPPGVESALVIRRIEGLHAGGGSS